MRPPGRTYRPRKEVTLHVSQVWHAVGVGSSVVNVSRSSSSLEWNQGSRVLLGYLKRMLAAIEHVADDNFVFQQNSTPACNTVQLLQRKIVCFIFPEPWPPTAQSWTPLTTRFRESYSSVNTICESSRLKKWSRNWLSLAEQQDTIWVKRCDFGVSVFC